MRKQRKTLLCILSLCICLFAGMWGSFDVQAEEYEGRPITGMDEEGNIYEIEPEVGWWRRKSQHLPTAVRRL